MSVVNALSSIKDLNTLHRRFGHPLRTGPRYSIPWRVRSRDETFPSAGAPIRSSGRRSVNPFFDDSLTYSDGVVVFSKFDYRTAVLQSL